MPDEPLDETPPAPAAPPSVLPFPLDPNTRFALKKGGFILSGIETLVLGVATIADRRIQTGSVALASYETPAGTTGTNLKAVCTVGVLTITAVGTGGSTITTDTSSVSFLIIL